MKEYPRRRDVRETLLSISRLLERNSITSYDDLGIDWPDFNHEFLTEVRDLMRDGASLEEALQVIDAAYDAEIEEWLAEASDEDLFADCPEDFFESDVGPEATPEVAPGAWDPIQQRWIDPDPHAEIVDALLNSPFYRAMIADLIVNEQL